ncbi:23S rRNA pseudouridine955/2504/2580 synthase [Caloramator quimbayensis]|uniref:RNA pseudouridylate synthase n=1 Tax=Caloramator quimbayensis TaxID=1147123 RepID=A0A1T4XNG9_9CLOT|nr:RluA family pseudouridine synthase [Caloramator quimbayensis]SKA90668.1 23S rRNA pseudouridine955/2504/2580 synthase [Caloramator quimbayensis]
MKEIVIRENEAGQRLDRFLRKYLLNMSLGNIYKAIRKKEITVNGNKSSEKYILSEGDIIKFNFKIEVNKEDKKLRFIDIDYEIDTAYEDENILVAVKGADTLVHPDEGKELTLTDAVLAYLYDKGEYNPEKEVTFSPSPCNRLDRNTSGLVIFAKNYETLKAVNEMIRDGKIKKYYSAIVKGRIAEGIYKAYILKDSKTNKSYVSKDYIKDSKEIETRIINIESVGQFSHIDIDLITGRSHQIRAHLSHLGNPILGDPKYGDKKLNSFFLNKYGLTNQLLIAYKLIFTDCPNNLKYLEGKTIVMPLPPLFKKIKKDIFKF